MAVVFPVKLDWAQVLHRLLTPRLPERENISMIVTLFCTTISPYLFFWQSSQETRRSPSILSITC